jgi:hypothetical protein
LAANVFDPMQDVAIYPNPSNEYFSISEAAAQVNLYTLTGQLIKSYTESAEGYQYSVADLAKGLYLVKITDEEGRSKLIKLVKN